MIHYQLRCGQSHGFDGWFKDSATFEKQAKRGLIECPECGGTDVERALMAPAVAKHGVVQHGAGLGDSGLDGSGRDGSGRDGAGARASGSGASGTSRTGAGGAGAGGAGTAGAGGRGVAPRARDAGAEANEKVFAGRLPAQMLAVLQRIRAEVERSCDYVGGDFADQALAMHRGEIAPKGIYGETTDEQAESLAEEGVAVAKIPWVPRADG